MSVRVRNSGADVIRYVLKQPEYETRLPFYCLCVLLSVIILKNAFNALSQV